MSETAAAIPSTFGPYRILAPLRRGGMGVVHRASHVETGGLVALKTARAHRVSELSALRDEVGVLRRLRHPGIVRLLDEGLSPTGPWYAMELVEGQSLAEIIARHWRPWRGADGSPTTYSGSTSPSAETLVSGVYPPARVAEAFDEAPHRESRRADRPPAGAGRLDEITTLVLRLAGVLAFLHGECVVHRDLKPENIIVRPDGTPVLLDFGLATRSRGATEREQLTSAGLVAGSAAYMAPEQVLGQFVDARADLYALGCILFEMVTGSPPFGASGNELLERHVVEMPPDPSTLVEGVPAPLRVLLRRLLAKQPRDRLGHADDVVHELASLGADSESLAGRDARLPKAYLYQSEIAGRTEVLARLDTATRALEDGQGGFVLVGGESGMGKTAVVGEVARRAKTGRQTEVVLGQCVTLNAAGRASADSNGGPLHALVPLFNAIADRCIEGGAAVTDQLVGARRTVLQPYLPALTDTDASTGNAESNDELPEAARERLVVAVADTLRALAELRPVLLVLDDLQWADELLSTFLSRVATGALEVGRVLILATYRTEEKSAELRALVDSPRTHHIELGRLDDASVGAMVSDMLAMAKPPEDFIRFIARNAEGKPFFVAEYLRVVVAEGLLNRASGQWQFASTAKDTPASRFEALPLPRSLLELTRLRLSRLSPAALNLAEALSVLGREADAAVLLATLSIVDAEEARERLRELSAQQVVESPEPSRIRYVHDKLREAVHAGIATNRRRELHRAAARALLGLRGEERAAELAYHFGQAGDEQEEASYAAIAGTEAQARGAHREAIALLERALAILEQSGSQSAELVRLSMTLGQANLNCKNFDAAIAASARAVRAAGLSPHPSGSRAVPMLLWHVGAQVARVLRPVRPASIERSRRASLLLASQALATMSTAMLYEADGLGVLSTSLRGLNLAEEAGGTNHVALGILGWAAGTAGLNRVAKAYFARAEVPGLNATDRVRAAHAALFAGNYLMATGQLGAAEQKGQALLTELAALGDKNLQSYACYNLAIGAYLRGDLGLSAYHFGAALDLSSDQEPRHRAVYVSGAALVAIFRGRLDEADALLASSAGSFTAKDSLPEAAFQGALALLFARKGEFGRAREVARRALTLLTAPRASMSHGLVALMGAAEVLFACRERAHASERRSLERELRGLIRRYRAWAAGYPIGRAEVLLQEGRLARVLGADRQARRLLEDSLAVARRGPLLLHEGLAHRLLAETYPQTSTERATHLRASLASLSRAGAHASLVAGVVEP
ncbi:MAG: protein kinase [Polyangiaceae bacterium]